MAQRALEVAVEKAEAIFLQVLTELRGQVERTAHLIRVGIATLAGMLGAIGLVTGLPDGIPAVAAVCLAVAVLCGILSVGVLVSTFVDPGGRRWVALGPDPSKIQGELERPGTSAADLLKEHLRAIGADAHQNQRTISMTVRRQSLGLVLLTAGVALLLLGLRYILGGSILG